MRKLQTPFSKLSAFSKKSQQWRVFANLFSTMFPLHIKSKIQMK